MDGLATGISALALGGVPLIVRGDDLPDVIIGSIDASGMTLQSGDIIVLAQKIISKAEGRLVALDSVIPSARAEEIAAEAHKDPRLVELILSESEEVMRVRPGVIIVRHRSGIVLANAGIDQSNILHAGRPHALLLPLDPDGSCRDIRTTLQQRTGADVAVLIIDSLGRAWRNGTTGTAIGVAGIAGLVDLRGRTDLYGRRLESSELGIADELAAAASLVMGQADERRPIVLIRGFAYEAAPGRAADLIRPRHLDLFP